MFTELCSDRPLLNIFSDLLRRWWLFLLACENLGERSTNHSPSEVFFFFFLPSRNQLARTKSILSARINPQWLGKLRRLWTHIPYRVACELVSLLDTHNMIVYRSFWWKCSTSSCAVVSLAVFIVVVIAAAVLFISDGGLRAFFRIPVCWSISRGKGGTQNAEGKE